MNFTKTLNLAVIMTAIYATPSFATQNVSAIQTIQTLQNITDNVNQYTNALSQPVRNDMSAADIMSWQKTVAENKALESANTHIESHLSMLTVAEEVIKQASETLSDIQYLANASRNTYMTSAQQYANAMEMQVDIDKIAFLADNTKWGNKTLLNGAFGYIQGVIAGTLVNGPSTSTILEKIVSPSTPAGTYTFVYDGTNAPGTLTCTRTADNVKQEIELPDQTIGATGEINLDFSAFGIKLNIKGLAAITDDLVGADLHNKTIVVGVGAQGAAKVQIGAGYQQTLTFSLPNINLKTITAIQDANLKNLYDAINTFINEVVLENSYADAEAILNLTDLAIESMEKKRINIGALSKKLEYAKVSNITKQKQNNIYISQLTTPKIAELQAKQAEALVQQQIALSQVVQANSAPSVQLGLFKK